MTVLIDEQSRGEMGRRLRTAEGQLRGIQKMVESGQPSEALANQLLAVRRALDSTHVHLPISLHKQSLSDRFGGDAKARRQTAEVMGELSELLSKVR